MGKIITKGYKQMKKTVLVLIMLALAFSVHAGSNPMGWNGPIAGSITGATAYHEFEMSSFKPEGFFSIQIVTSGAGTLTVTYELSNVKNPASTDYVDPSATAIVTAKAAGSGFYQFPATGEVIFAKYIRLKLVATGAVVYTLYPNIQ